MEKSMLNTLRNALSIALILIFSVSCSDNSSESTKEAAGLIGTTEFILKDSTNLSFDGTTLKGSGSAVAKLPADEVAGEKNFQLSFTLDEGGSLELAAFTNESMLKGVGIKFSRTGENLKVELKNNDATLDISAAFSEVVASELISVHFDVHNGETPAHIIGWTSATPDPDTSNSKFDSERDEADFGAFSGKGTGTYWGLILQSSQVTQAEPREVKLED